MNKNEDSDGDDYKYGFIYNKDNMPDEDDDLVKEVQNDKDDSKADDYDLFE